MVNDFPSPYREAVEWLLGSPDPGVRYLALRDLSGLSEGDPELEAARKIAHQSGAIATVLEHMEPAGYWGKPGPGYGPKYFSTVWAIILLAQLGARRELDERIEQACTYLMEHALTAVGQFTYNGTPGGNFACLQGNLVWSLLELGVPAARLENALDWMARSVTGEGIAPITDKKAAERYTAYNCGPDFACGANYGQSCAWGAVKVMLAFGRLPATARTPTMERAITRSLDFLFSVDPATAAYPTGTGIPPSSKWWKFGFPVFYVTDLLQEVEALLAVGRGGDPRLDNSLALIRSKANERGRWALENNYTSKTWVNFGPRKENPWVTQRALKVLKAAGPFPG